ncbi:exodeoxyribonuclease III [Patescibacteria group bacterium]|nr:exodeoxyribonuclease III [Patescibacteria group bacterium]
MKILSWNVNGIRAAYKKGILDFLKNEKPDILCVQEIKAKEDQLPKKLIAPQGYVTCWNPAEKKGYSGTAIFSRIKPTRVKTDFGEKSPLSQEGRVIEAEYDRFILFNVYFPNGKKDADRLTFKMDFYKAFLHYIDRLKKKGKKIIFCGDVNTAHTEKDIARPKENSKRSGFLPMERAWIDTVIKHGYVDTFRKYNTKPDQYSWWDLKTRARERNVGWRIDYFFVSKNCMPYVKDAFILKDVFGSDHAPVGVTLKGLNNF